MPACAVLVALQQQGSQLVPELVPAASVPAAAQLITYYHSTAVAAWHKPGHPGWSRWEEVGSPALAKAFQGHTQLPRLILPGAQTKYGQPQDSLAGPLLAGQVGLQQGVGQGGVHQQAEGLLRRNAQQGSHRQQHQHQEQQQQQQQQTLGGPSFPGGAQSSPLIGEMVAGYGLLGDAPPPQQRAGPPPVGWPVKQESRGGAPELQASSIAAFLEGDGNSVLDALLGGPGMSPRKVLCGRAAACQGQNIGGGHAAAAACGRATLLPAASSHQPPASCRCLPEVYSCRICHHLCLAGWCLGPGQHCAVTHVPSGMLGSTSQSPAFRRGSPLSSTFQQSAERCP